MNALLKRGSELDYRDIEKLPKSHPDYIAFVAYLEWLDGCMSGAGDIYSAHKEEGSVAEFDRYIAGDR